MALRQIRILGDPVLEKVSRPVKEVTPRIKELIEDMLETMYEKDGVGLAACQVGVLRRVVVIDVGDEEGNADPIIMINPEIVKQDGEQFGDEGCLSYPGKSGKVRRPDHVIAKYYDEDMKEHTIEAYKLLARAICHELDHLDGHMYVEKVEGEIVDAMAEAENEAEVNQD